MSPLFTVILVCFRKQHRFNLKKVSTPIIAAVLVLKTVNMDITENKSYKCDFCCETFESQDLLDDHMFTCVEINPVVCPVCYLVFAGQVQLDEHPLIVHNNDNREPTNDRLDESSQICYENQDLDKGNLPEKIVRRFRQQRRREARER